MAGWAALRVCAMRKAAYTEPGKGTDSSTTCGWWRAMVSRVRAFSCASTRVGGAASAAARGSKVGWLIARDLGVAHELEARVAGFAQHVGQSLR
jgi:hypothetical protein